MSMLLLFQQPVGGGTTNVEADGASSYQVLARVQKDGVGAYVVATNVLASASSSHQVLQRIQANGAAAYAVASKVQKDGAAAYAVAALVQVSGSSSYGVEGKVQADGAGSYAVRQFVFADGASSHQVHRQVAADGAGAHAVSQRVFADAAGSYIVLAPVVSSREDAYLVWRLVTADGEASFAVDGVQPEEPQAVFADASTEFQILQFVAADSGCSWDCEQQETVLAGPAPLSGGSGAAGVDHYSKSGVLRRQSTDEDEDFSVIIKQRIHNQNMALIQMALSVAAAGAMQ